MEEEESETLAKKTPANRYFSKGKNLIFLEVRSLSEAQKKTDYGITLRKTLLKETIFMKNSAMNGRFIHKKNVTHSSACIIHQRTVIT